MAEPTDSPPGLFASLQRLWRTLLAVGLNRLELALVEVEEERRQIVEALLLILVVAMLALMTLLVGTLALVLAFWEQRMAVLMVLGPVFLLATAIAYGKLRQRLDHWSTLPATLAELKKDKAWLDDTP